MKNSCEPKLFLHPFLRLARLDRTFCQEHAQENRDENSIRKAAQRIMTLMALQNRLKSHSMKLLFFGKERAKVLNLQSEREIIIYVYFIAKSIEKCNT